MDKLYHWHINVQNHEREDVFNIENILLTKEDAMTLGHLLIKGYDPRKHGSYYYADAFTCVADCIEDAKLSEILMDCM